MRLLLDTQILIWAALDKLPAKALSYIEDESNILYYSPASLWEIVIKNSLGRPDFHINPQIFFEGLRTSGYQELPITSKHALWVEKLPGIHKDPFDRMLLAQQAHLTSLS